MTRGRILLITMFITGFVLKSFSQEGVVTAGFQVKPVFSSDYFKTGPKTAEFRTALSAVELKSGYCVGMVIRRGFSNKISLETGINYTRRNYEIAVKDSAMSVIDNFKFIGYEIPLSLLVYIRLGEKMFMDVSFGGSADFYPSDIYTSDSSYYQDGLRPRWLSPALISNIGFEYRTEKAGYFYLGASFHRPFDAIMNSFVTIRKRNEYPKLKNELNGNYLTVDLRYFFHEDPLSKQRKKEN